MEYRARNTRTRWNTGLGIQELGRMNGRNKRDERLELKFGSDEGLGRKVVMKGWDYMSG